MKSFMHEWLRVVDVYADVEEGGYPLIDLFRLYGRITFQLYAGCLGCDFTHVRSGITGIGYNTFVSLAKAVEGNLTAGSLAAVIWEKQNVIAQADGFDSAADVEAHLQRVVDVYSKGRVYDDKSNIISMSGQRISAANQQTVRHMAGKNNSRTMEPHPSSLTKAIESIDCSQLLLKTAADASTIRGANLPENKTPSECTVSILRDFIAARGGKISGRKEELVALVDTYQFIEKQVPKVFVDRNPNPNGILYAKIDTSGKQSIGAILGQLHSKVAAIDDAGIRSLVQDVHGYYQQGLFDDKYDNIARVAPELKEGFIYNTFSHIGSSIREKNIGDALKRCFYENKTSYHGMALLPDLGKAFILSKAQASMARDEKTRNDTDEGEPPEKQQYLVIMELIYKPSDEIEDIHSLGVFVRMGRSYCVRCIAGQGSCHHRSERLWYQYHHWTEDRLGID